jgi:hypothetical protein
VITDALNKYNQIIAQETDFWLLLNFTKEDRALLTARLTQATLDYPVLGQVETTMKTKLQHHMNVATFEEPISTLDPIAATIKLHMSDCEQRVYTALFNDYPEEQAISDTIFDILTTHRMYRAVKDLTTDLLEESIHAF